MSERQERWCVLWDLEIIRVDDWDADSLKQLDAPDGNCFRLTFPSLDAAAAFVGEIQRYTGGMISQLLHKGIKLTTKVDMKLEGRK